MNGTKFFLDTNAFIYFFEGRSKITQLVSQASVIYFSPISEIELLSAPHLTPLQITQIRAFLSLCSSVTLNPDVVHRAISMRRHHRIKTPDAVIAASAQSVGAPLISADRDFRKIEGITLITDILE